MMLTIISYFIQLTVTSEADLSIIQYPQDINVSLDSTVWMLCEFDYPDEAKVDTDVYWRKGPMCNQPGLQSSTHTSLVQKSKIQIITKESKRFSVLWLDSIQMDDSGTYFCEVSLTEPPPVRKKCGSGSKLTVHEFKCNSSIRHEKPSWVWFFLLGYSICSSILIFFCVLQCCKKYRINSRNKDDICTLPSEWTYDKPSRAVNIGFNQEYEDMTLMRNFTHNERKI